MTLAIDQEDAESPGAARAAAAVAKIAAQSHVREALHAVADAIGGTHAHFALRRIDAGPGIEKTARRFMTYDEAPIEAYAALGLWTTDPVVAHSLQSTAPICFGELDWSGEGGRQSMALRTRFGLGPSGLVVSVRGPCGRFGTLLVTSPCEAPPWRGRKRAALADLLFFATHLFERTKGFVGPDRRKDHEALSPRELEALGWTARGKTIDETATITGLARSTVRHSLDNARRKLGAATKPQAVARAVSRQLISAD